MFICNYCGTEYVLPTCGNCGYTTTTIDGIWQLSNDPDIVTSGDGYKYIGYEYIGEHYSGGRKNIIEYSDALFSDEIAKLTGNGIFLDLGCGDGCFTVPAARNAIKIIAADISNAMLMMLKQRAAGNNISLSKVTICRMNALKIMMANESVDCVAANSVLHLISHPEKVIREIYRVLKPGGCFVFKDDRPGEVPDTPFDNDIYNKIVNELYALYWASLKKHNVFPQKYSWNFDREAVCSRLFPIKEQKIVPARREYQNKIKDGFLPRIAGRGFSDQVNVPLVLHSDIMVTVIEQIKKKYGDNFGEVAFHGIESDIDMTIYRK